MGTLDEVSAGASPKTTVTNTTDKSVKSSTFPSVETSSSRGRFDGASFRRSSSAHFARTSPANPPRVASTRASTRSWRTSRSRLAPSAERTAISSVRTEARASIRCATLAQAMSRTTPTAPRRTRSAKRTSSPTMVRSKLIPRNDFSKFESGY